MRLLVMELPRLVHTYEARKNFSKRQAIAVVLSQQLLQLLLADLDPHLGRTPAASFLLDRRHENFAMILLVMLHGFPEVIVVVDPCNRLLQLDTVPHLSLSPLALVAERD
ncbi:unnamed protein product [Musa acuminata subsp. malaccensis]|uniref:(wild Malaysian banana) hypothetical protein n=1 Tax=Musa acuminata subsp. malaccensis TaxID=214687 RepID=A0A8D7AE54_MUSAM|nr:unnamed protein product [Musa acuminata subsp. malaccensis]